jgi:hypothetical protein
LIHTGHSSLASRPKKDPQNVSELAERLSLSMDPRDLIYSQLSLIPDGNLFTVNYDEDVNSLFWRAGG